MSNNFKSIIKSLASVFANNKKMSTLSDSSEPNKLYTFIVQGEGIRKSVNIRASDKASAERKVNIQYPGCKAEFLWEMIRSPQ